MHETIEPLSLRDGAEGPFLTLKHLNRVRHEEPRSDFVKDGIDDERQDKGHEPTVETPRELDERLGVALSLSCVVG